MGAHRHNVSSPTSPLPLLIVLHSLHITFLTLPPAAAAAVTLPRARPSSSPSESADNILHRTIAKVKTSAQQCLPVRACIPHPHPLPPLLSQVEVEEAKKHAQAQPQAHQQHPPAQRPSTSAMKHAIASAALPVANTPVAAASAILRAALTQAEQQHMPVSTNTHLAARLAPLKVPPPPPSTSPSFTSKL